MLGSLRRLGVSLLMDDFGTGYSSLNYLHSFPFDVLKIDRSFVGRMTEGDQPLQIVRTIIELARVLGMDVVAEGIETREQYRLLRQIGLPLRPGLSVRPPHERRSRHPTVAAPRPRSARSRGRRSRLHIDLRGAGQMRRIQMQRMLADTAKTALDRSSSSWPLPHYGTNERFPNSKLPPATP